MCCVPWAEDPCFGVRGLGLGSCVRLERGARVPDAGIPEQELVDAVATGTRDLGADLVRPVVHAQREILQPRHEPRRRAGDIALEVEQRPLHDLERLRVRIGDVVLAGIPV